MSERLDVAYYYPAPYWGMGEGGWVKSLLLFFDKVSILLSDYMYGRHRLADPVLAEPLEDQGLLEVLEPKTWIDQEMAKRPSVAWLPTAYSTIFPKRTVSTNCHSPA